MTSLVLVAASGLAREVLAVERSLGRYDDVLLVDDDPGLWGSSIDGTQVVGGLDVVADLGRVDLVVCAGRGSVRRDLVDRLSRLGVPADRYARVVHPGVDVPDGCCVGRGSVLLASTVLTAGVTVGSHVVVMPHVTFTHDDVVEDFATICAGVTLGGHVRVGEAAYLGMNACVRERLSVGRESVLGMGAALVESLPPGQTWVGVPARPRCVALVPGG